MTFDELLKELDELQNKLIAQSKDKIGMDDYTDQIRAYQHIINDHIKLSEASARACKELEDRLLKLESMLLQPRVEL